MVWQLPCVAVDDNGNGRNNFRKIDATFPEIVVEAAEEANSLASSSLDLVPVSERLRGAV